MVITTLALTHHIGLIVATRDDSFLVPPCWITCLGIANRSYPSRVYSGRKFICGLTWSIMFGRTYPLMNLFSFTALRLPLTSVHNVDEAGPFATTLQLLVVMQVR